MIAPYTESDDLRTNLIASHRHLCAKGARRFVRPGLERCDLEQVAAIGLIKATDRYDASHETPFEAFAWVFVLGELMHYVRDHERLIRAPRRLRDLERRWQRAHDELVTRLKRNPTRSEIQKHLQLSDVDVDDLRCYRRRAAAESLHIVLHGDEDRAPAVAGGIDRETKMDLDAALDSLPKRERLIVLGIYVQGLSQTEVARRLGYSTRHVSRLHRSALQQLLNFLVRDSSGSGTSE